MLHLRLYGFSGPPSVTLVLIPFFSPSRQMYCYGNNSVKDLWFNPQDHMILKQKAEELRFTFNLYPRTQRSMCSKCKARDTDIFKMGRLTLSSGGLFKVRT